jgi:hypothetical protein
MEQHGSHQHEAGDPMRRDPAELDADDREERRTEENQHASRADPVEDSIGKRVPHDPVGGRDICVGA